VVVRVSRPIQGEQGFQTLHLPNQGGWPAKVRRLGHSDEHLPPRNLFAPRSIALVGASPRERSVGRMILRNLREAGFAGSIQLVNPKYPEIEGIRPVGNVADPTLSDSVIKSIGRGFWHTQG
jgi:CoA binding domain